MKTIPWRAIGLGLAIGMVIQPFVFLAVLAW